MRHILNNKKHTEQDKLKETRNEVNLRNIDVFGNRTPFLKFFLILECKMAVVSKTCLAFRVTVILQEVRSWDTMEAPPTTATTTHSSTNNLSDGRLMLDPGVQLIIRISLFFIQWADTLVDQRCFSFYRNTYITNLFHLLRVNSIYVHVIEDNHGDLFSERLLTNLQTKLSVDGLEFTSLDLSWVRSQTINMNN